MRGSVKISSLSVGGKEIVFATFNAGDIFGEIAVLDGEERSADATAMTECELLVLNRRDFCRSSRGHADLCMILLRTLCRRLRQTTEQVEDVMFLDLESRVAKGLLQLVAPVGLRGLHSPSVELHVSQRELGNMAGGSRASVNKIFQNWYRRGLINLSKGSITIHNVEAIRQTPVSRSRRAPAARRCSRRRMACSLRSVSHRYVAAPGASGILTKCRQLCRGRDTPMAGDQRAVLVDQRRVRPPPLADRRGDFVEVGFAVEPRVLYIGDQPFDRPALDAVGWPRPYGARLGGPRIHECHWLPSRRQLPSNNR